MAEKELLEFSIPSRIADIDVAVARIVAFASDAGLDENALFAVDMAAREAVANAAKHGNGLDPAKSVDIEVSVDGGNLRIRIRDRGKGFDGEGVPDPTDPENLLKGSGRGVLFMRNFMDEVAWSPHPEGGTVVSMLKIR